MSCYLSVTLFPYTTLFRSRNEDGFVIEEGTRPIDSYTASSFTAAGYVNLEIPLHPVTLNGGLRVEYNIQKLNSNNDFSEIVVDNPVLSVLQFLNASAALSEKFQLRFGYGEPSTGQNSENWLPLYFMITSWMGEELGTLI